MQPNRPNSWMPQGSPLPPPSPGGPGYPYGNSQAPLPGPEAPRSRPRSYRAALAGGLVGALVAAGVAFATVELTDHTNTKVVTVADTSGSASATVAPAADTPNTQAPVTTAAGGSVLANDPEVGLEIHDLIAKVSPSVVSIEVSQDAGNGELQALAAGSGVVISADGLVLTNAHVVTVQDSFGQTIAHPVFTIKMNDGTVREAKVLGTAPDFDVALMRLTDTSNLTPITLGKSADVRVGDDVVAIGNALALGDSPTITRGIVSALNRSLEETSTVTLHGLIQTDAPINHGNSGGALVDSKGRLIGINSAGIPDAQNIGFAIAIDTITPLLDDLKAGRTVTQSPSAFLGVTVSQTPNGLEITSITDGSGAAKAGLQAGDIFIKVGDTSISTEEQLREALRDIKPGANTQVQVRRNGETVTVTVQMGTRDS